MAQRYEFFSFKLPIGYYKGHLYLILSGCVRDVFGMCSGCNHQYKKIEFDSYSPERHQLKIQKNYLVFAYVSRKSHTFVSFLRTKKGKNMKKMILMALMLVCGMATMMAQKPAEIKFEKLTHNFGTFSEKNPKVTCTFSYTNVGEKPLVINQAIASCGCTVPEYTKTPIQPGGKGTIKVTYNGEGKFPGHFKKTITIRTNGAIEMTRLYIEGDMTE